MDGPVVQAAQQALDAGEVSLILPYAPKEAEEEIRRAFESALPHHRNGSGARQLADLYFFETVVRLHRAGEGEPFTGLKPAGLSTGPVIPLAEKAIQTGSAADLVDLVTDAVQTELEKRLRRVACLQARSHLGIDEARDYVSAMLGFQVYAHHLYVAAQSDPHHGGRVRPTGELAPDQAAPAGEPCE
jgi:hypothetical protein